MQTPIKVSNIKSSDLLTESLYDIKDQEFTLVENKDNPMSLAVKKRFNQNCFGRYSKNAD